MHFPPNFLGRDNGNSSGAMFRPFRVTLKFWGKVEGHDKSSGLSVSHGKKFEARLRFTEKGREKTVFKFNVGLWSIFNSVCQKFSPGFSFTSLGWHQKLWATLKSMSVIRYYSRSVYSGCFPPRLMNSLSTKNFITNPKYDNYELWIHGRQVGFAAESRKQPVVW